MPDAKTTKLATVTDIHQGESFDTSSTAAPVDEVQKHVRAGKKLTEELIAEANAENVDGLINLGDVIESEPNGSRENDRQLLKEAAESFGAATIPVLHCLGNHDLMNAPLADVLQSLGLEQRYYSRDINGHHIVVLSTVPDNVKTGANIRIDAEQLQWLKKDLAETSLPAIVAAHHPLADEDLRGNIWFENHPECALVENRDEVREIIAQSGKVIGVLNGHTHWSRLQVHDGIPFVSQGSLVEDVNGAPARHYGIATLKDYNFGMEIFGKNGAFGNHQWIAHQTAETYNGIAQSYDRETAPFGARECEQFDIIANQFFPQGGTVVDMGCGPARDAHHFMKRGFHYIGVEGAKEFLQLAHKKLQAIPEASFELHQGDFSRPHLPEGKANIIWHSSTLQHVDRQALPQTLKTCFHLLAPGGVLYAHYRSKEGAFSGKESLVVSSEYGRPIARFIATYEEEEMNNYLREAGFVVLGSKRFDHGYSGLKGHTVKYKTRVIAIKPQDGKDYREGSAEDLVLEQ